MAHAATANALLIGGIVLIVLAISALVVWLMYYAVQYARDTCHNRGRAVQFQNIQEFNDLEESSVSHETDSED